MQIGKESTGDIGRAQGLLSFPNGRVPVVQSVVNTEKCNQKGRR